MMLVTASCMYVLLVQVIEETRVEPRELLLEWPHAQRTKWFKRHQNIEKVSHHELRAQGHGAPRQGLPVGTPRRGAAAVSGRQYGSASSVRACQLAERRGSLIRILSVSPGPVTGVQKVSRLGFRQPRSVSRRGRTTQHSPVWQPPLTVCVKRDTESRASVPIRLRESRRPSSSDERSRVTSVWGSDWPTASLRESRDRPSSSDEVARE